jgi:hypothetical protein
MTDFLSSWRHSKTLRHKIIYLSNSFTVVAPFFYLSVIDFKIPPSIGAVVSVPVLVIFSVTDRQPLLPIRNQYQTFCLGDFLDQEHIMTAGRILRHL